MQRCKGILGKDGTYPPVAYTLVGRFSLNNFIYLFVFGAVLGLCCCSGFSLVAANGGYSVVAVHGLLVAVASPLAGHAL